MRLRLALATALCLLPLPAIAQTSGKSADKTSVELSSGIEYQQGSYGLSQNVDLLSVPTTLTVRHGKLTFAASLPYVRLSAPANVVTGGILGVPIIVPPTTSTERRTRGGIGDVRLTGSYTISSAPVGFSLSAQVKLPTASFAKGIGTGKADVALGGELFKQVGRVTPYLDLAYTMPGSPAGYRLDDSLSGQIGAAVQLGRRVRGHLGYAYAQTISPAIGDQQSLVAGLNMGIARKTTLAMYGSAGLSRGAPDMVAGLQIGLGFD